MKKGVPLLLVGVLVLTSVMALGQPTRQDVIWARTAPTGSITLDGDMSEAVWAQAESVKIEYGKAGPIPGSGYRSEGGRGDSTTDPTVAMFKFLVVDNDLYIGVNVLDSSVTGGTWARFDAFLGNIRNKASMDRPAPAFEVFYGWVAESWADTNTAKVGALPGYFGSESGPRTPTSKWDAATIVHGISNNDTTADEGYTTEFKFRLSEFGYDVTQPDGDIVVWSTSIWDSDWKDDLVRFQSNRVWLQGPWGNARHYNTMRVIAKPSVTVSSGPVLAVAPEVVIPSGLNFSAPTIDGDLNEPVWTKAPGTTLRFGDDALRSTYPGAGALTSGQFQPELVPGLKPPVIDPGEGTVKMFFKGDILYVAADINDQVVQVVSEENRKDGFTFSINDRQRLDVDNRNLYGHYVTVFLDTLPDGQVTPLLSAGAQYLRDSINALQVAVALKPNTVLDTIGAVPDEGYRIELALDLSKLGYGFGRGDGVAFIGAQIWDGDSFIPTSNNYGTRVWWFRENPPYDAAAWAYMDVNTIIPGEAVVLPPGTRTDAVWARSAPAASLTMDGVMNEAAWATAESIRVEYGKPATPLPGSGFVSEGGRGGSPTDPTKATFKFLTMGNELWIGVHVQDSSVTGGTWAKFDAFLGNIRNKAGLSRPAPPFEIFYGWVAESWADPNTANVGALPGYFGSEGGPRTPTSKWDAATVVHGVSNDDATADQGYTTEFILRLTDFGYDVTQPGGDVIIWSTSIWDSDWKDDLVRFESNRCWLQGPWGNARHYNTLRIHANPGVTTTSGAVPAIPPELVVQNGQNVTAPTIDGQLNEGVWKTATGTTLRYGDDALRATYPGAGALTSGDFQIEIGGVKAPVIDPAEGAVKMFFKGDMLYVAADINDQVVQAVNEESRKDGVTLSLNDRVRLDGGNSNQYTYYITVFVDTAANGSLQPLLSSGALYLRDDLGALTVAMALKPNTVIDTVGLVPDEGYQIEMAIDLAKLGYPSGLGDGVLFAGAQIWDGDSFIPTTNNYGTRVWWFRENAPYDSPVWAYMDPSAILTGVEGEQSVGVPAVFSLLGNYPNPFNPSTTIRYTLAQESNVTVEVFDVIGRSIATVKTAVQQPGVQQVVFDASNLPSGAYFYRVIATSPKGGRMLATMNGKMMLIK